jgi:hypothetical protein
LGERSLVIGPHAHGRMIAPSRFRAAGVLADGAAQRDQNLLGLDALLAETFVVENGRGAVEV